MDKRAYWIWFQHAFGAGSAKPWSIFNRFSGGVAEFYDGGPMLWNSLPFISEKEARALHTFNLSQAEILLETALKLSQKVLTPECEKYPEALRNIFDPPAVLYYKGTIPDVDTKPAIAIVGARKASERAVNAAMTFGYQLALLDAVVISGGALGVDTAAHKGAMRGMGETICVLPCGLENGYLVENHSLRERIAEKGLLITEYPMNTGVTRGTFQVRNRIMSGLSCGVLIVEAAERSGALITARHAREQSRDIFVFPGANDDPKAKGSNALISDGAKAVRAADEIMEEYDNRFLTVRSNSEFTGEDIQVSLLSGVPTLAEPKNADYADTAAVEADSSITDEAKRVMRAVASDSSVHVSEICAITDMPISKVFQVLTELELIGYVEAMSGRRYKLKGLAKANYKL